MEQSYPFVVTVASEKGGVGKTTIATNLAVFLKALREDLPVTIASFDNHFSVDSMFAIGRHYGPSVAGLFDGTPAADLAQMGEFGVQFLASDRGLSPPDDDPGHLRRVLARSGLSGILVLDTRPILDYFTQNALLAADLVLIPVKDRASLVNVASIRQTLEQIGGDPEKLWLVPSLVDKRLKLRGDIGIHQFLTSAAEERGYQVVDTYIAKSPKVEGLATNLSSRTYPVLTHARYTNVHHQFRTLADFVLERCEGGGRPANQCFALETQLSEEVPLARLRRLLPECPLCGEATNGEDGSFFQDMRTRRRGFLHKACQQALLDAASLDSLPLEGGVLVAEKAGSGETDREEILSLHLFDAEGEAVESGEALAAGGSLWESFLRGATGRDLHELFRDSLLLTLDEGPPARFVTKEGYAEFVRRRRRVMREVLLKAL